MDEEATPARRSRTAETWGAARGDYLAGLSAAAVCARYDLGLSALRARARREGWRRADQADPDPDLAEDLDEELEDQGPADLAAMIERAFRLADRALGFGRVAEAQGWMRLWRQLRLAQDAEQDKADRRRRSEAADTAAGLRTVDRAARTGALLTKLQADLAILEPALADAVHAPSDMHSVHLVHPVLGCTSQDEPKPPAPPLNRADRRRRAKLTMAQATTRNTGPP